jgi:NADPH:quinone reductase-like Zn-dependent oxidoreductase
VAAVRSFGADTIIDYRTQGGTAFGKNFDVIINASGKMPFALGKRFLKSNGRLIEPSPTIPVFIGSMLANVFRSKKHLVLTTVPKRADLDFLSSLIAQGKLKPSVAEVFPLSEAKQAFAAMEKGGANGKIIVTI